MDTLAARLREAFLGTETGEAVPFDELKDAVKDRWQRVADAAAIRVPFSDAQIERMAKAARETLLPDEPEDGAYWPHWLAAVRAALAAGGLEPCAVPEYAPDDVALHPSDDEVEALARALHAAWNVKRFGVAPKWEDSTVQDAYRAEARAAIAHLRPTQGHVLRDRLVEAEAKIERQRKNLRQLYEARERDAQLIADLRDEIDEDNAAATSVNDLLVQVQNLTAERDAQEIELTDLRFYQREFAAVSAERDALRERASVPVKVRWDVSAPEAADWIRSSGGFPAVTWMSENKYMADGLICAAMRYLAAHAVIDAPAGVPSDPPAGQVEALARVLEEATAEGFEEEHRTYMRRLARAAIAHLNTRPEGLPTAEELLDRWAEFSVSEDTKEQFYLAALRPWLRDPVGWEMDVHPDQLELYKWVTEPDGGYAYAAQQALDLCRSRIRPVYECKECATIKGAALAFVENAELNARSARAALEGE